MNFISILLGELRRAASKSRRAQRQAEAYAERIANNIEENDTFNTRWLRLNGIVPKVMDNFVMPLVEGQLTSNEWQKLQHDLTEMYGWHVNINDKINCATNTDLSRYATCIKRVALRSIKLCGKYKICNVESVEFASYSKTIVVNGEALYCLG